MKEYIERAVAVQELEVLRQEYEMHDDCDELVARRCRDALSAVPAADVAEVRHGRWMTTDAYPHHLYCSVCYKTYAKNAKWVNELDLPTNYCPNCGSRMDKEDEQ